MTSKEESAGASHLSQAIHRSLHRFFVAIPGVEMDGPDEEDAEIVNGKYRTNEASGVVGGAYQLQILGYETSSTATEATMFPDVPLFPLYTDELQLEAADAVINFEVPEQ